MTDTRPKAYSYLRFSTPEQSKGDSSRRQTSMATEYAHRHGLDLDTSLTFQDLGVSAYRGRNAEVGRLADFLEAVKVGLVPQGSFLLVEGLDRLSRLVPRKALRVLEDIIESGVFLVTLNDGKAYDAAALDDPLGLLTAILVFMRANEESATKARRLKAAWEGKRLAIGEKPLTARAPAWLTLDKTTGTFNVIPDRGVVVCRIFQMHGEGLGQQSIAVTFNREKVPTFGNSLQWHSSYIAKILDSPTVMGRLTPHTVEYQNGKKVRKPQQYMDNYYPVVVAPEVFARVQAGRQDNRTPPHRRTQAGISSLFAGLARCPECGSTMTRVMKGKGPKGGHPYLVCTKAKGGAGCVYYGVRQDRIEEAFLLQAPDLTYLVPSGDDSIDQIIETLEGNIYGAQEWVQRTAEALTSAPGSLALSKQLRAAEDELESLEVQHREALDRAATVSGPVLEAKLSDLRTELQARPLNIPKVNTLMRQVFHSVVVDYRKGLLLLQWKQGGESEIMYQWVD